MSSKESSKSTCRNIHTGLYGDQAYKILDSMRGQLSDGKWENTPGYEKYWTNLDIYRQDDGEVIIAVNAMWAGSFCGRIYDNPFQKMTDTEVTNWCARKIKAVIKDELKTGMIGNWDRKNLSSQSVYLGPFSSSSKKKAESIVTVADVYCTYEALLGRATDKSKYDAKTLSNVFGAKRTDAEIAKIYDARAAKEAVILKHTKKRDILKKAAENKIDKLSNEISKLEKKITSVKLKLEEQIQKIAHQEHVELVKSGLDGSI